MSVFTSKFLLMGGVSTTTTSAGVVVGDRTRVGLQYIVGNYSAGNVKFTVEVSDDNVNWVGYNRILSNSTAGAAYTTLTIAAAKSDMAFKPDGDNFSYLRVKLNYNNATAGTLVTVFAVGVK